MHQTHKIHILALQLPQYTACCRLLTGLISTCKKAVAVAQVLASWVNSTRTPASANAMIAKRAGFGMLTSRLARLVVVKAAWPAVLHNHPRASA